MGRADHRPGQPVQPSADLQRRGPAQVDVDEGRRVQVGSLQRAVDELHPLQTSPAEVRLDEDAALEDDVSEPGRAQVQTVDLAAADQHPLQHRPVQLRSAEAGVGQLHVPQGRLGQVRADSPDAAQGRIQDPGVPQSGLVQRAPRQRAVHEARARAVLPAEVGVLELQPVVVPVRLQPTALVRLRHRQLRSPRALHTRTARRSPRHAPMLHATTDNTP
ncbi:hypothetical protein DF19_36910 [Streptomyces olindensis]|nr:hypothetical protein DF19_36910 [Streptomyces olindensis]